MNAQSRPKTAPQHHTASVVASHDVSDLAQLAFADNAPTTKVNVVLYGAPGSGKSTAAGSAPGSSLLWLNAEGRNSTAFVRRQNAAKTLREVIVAEQHGFSTRGLLQAFVEEAQTGEYGTVVVDTVGALRSLLVKELVAKGSRLALKQYGEVADAMTEFILALRDVPSNLVLLCHEEQVKNEDGAVVSVLPAIGGRATDEVIREMDVVAYCSVVDGEDGLEYVAQFVPGRGRVAKDRSNGLGRFGPSACGHVIPTALAALQTPADAAADDSDTPWGSDGDAR